MKSLFRYFGAFALLVMTAVSCTVKEDRTPCPCWLEVSFVDRSEIFAPVNLLGWDGVSLFDESIRAEMHPDGYVKAVDKGVFHLVSVLGAKNQKVRDRFILIEYGNQADSVYWHCCEVDATGEFAYADVDFTKQFATVYLDIRKDPGDMNDYMFRVEGGVCGFDLLTGIPVEGAFCCEPFPVAGSAVTTFRVPRQLDDSLMLSVSYDDGLGLSSGSSFEMGKYIASLGYDWSAAELKDIYITVDVIGGRINVGVSGWENNEESDFGRVEI